MTAVPPPSAHPAPLTRQQANDVLRYWLTAVRLEETLKTRPRARRVKHPTDSARLDFPALGQDYFKLALDRDVARLLHNEEALRRPFDGELTAFFEGWLYNQYRRSQDDSELNHLLCLPVVHLPRGELAGLLRCAVRLRFGSGDGAPFRPPSRAERNRGAYPAAPSEVHVSIAPRAEGTWPFFIDTRLLSYPLGLSGEEIDALFEALRARGQVDAPQMLELVANALEQAARDGDAAPTRSETSRGAPSDADAQLTRLYQAMQVLLVRGQTRATAYPVGVVIDGTQAKTTWHLQRELTSLIEEQEESAWRPDSCLGRYLVGAPAHREGGSREAPQRGLFPGPALTAHQRSAAEHFWGSTFTCVQGPPGTGKTTLILHLCAEALLRQVDGLLDGSAMGAELLVIASSNNRAVDNVIDPLSNGEGLPLALRVGSRQVNEQVLSARLRQTIGWLKHSQVVPAAVHRQTLERDLAHYAALRSQLEQQLAPRKRALADAAERASLQQAHAALLDLAPESTTVSARAPKLSLAAASAIETALIKVESRMAALGVLCAQKPSMAQVNAVARHYERTAKRDLPMLEATLAEAGLLFELPLPPRETPLDVAELMAVWEDGADAFCERLSALRELVERTLGADELARKTRSLSERLSALGPAPDGQLPLAGGHDALSLALFSAAVRVREAWAKVHAEKLCGALEAACLVAAQEKSLRPLFRNEPEHATLLCRLFGVWGSTLLSLGNCLPADAHSVARVVIDEAGQCHPAHAVSALMRCKSAMLIGDVHQLSPVIELTADDDARIVKSSRLTLGLELLRPYRVSAESQVSAQSLAERAVPKRYVLVDHFRCLPEIISISDQLCGYGLNVLTLRGDHEPRFFDHPVSLLDLRGAQERLAGSLYNELELRETLALVATLLARGAAPSEIAVITPYRGQLERLRQGLLFARVPLEYSPELADGEGPTPRSASGLALGTVHRFQGGERRIVLFSSVVTRTGSLTFLNARPNLLNVAVSRAQRHFVCLGHRSVLLQGKLTRLLVEAASPLALDVFG
jgi:RecA/RadA recombinase